ncbi:MAG: hypothetical protein A2511_05715 [Deltaproteobacteria bacterium RIFOXYD12_FULL_50_9]|nr:MAG: hypothetical protein A2511_05715 [Deltaproteobacteria bacterium RIFOXYD12_FULL_50_9]
MKASTKNQVQGTFHQFNRSQFRLRFTGIEGIDMKKLLVGAALTLIVIITGSLAMAATNTLTVNGTVTGTCKFITPASSLSFTLDPSLATDAIATTTPSFWCTRGATYSATTDDGMNFLAGKRMKSTGSPSEFIKYSVDLTSASGTGSGKSTPILLLVTGTVSNADYINALAANDYTDSVVITITP